MSNKYKNKIREILINDCDMKDYTEHELDEVVDKLYSITSERLDRAGKSIIAFIMGRTGK